MNALIKVSVALFGVVFVFFALIFVLNMGDVVPSPKAKEFETSVRPVPGFALSNLPKVSARMSKVPQNFKYTDYASARQAMDDLLAENAEAVHAVVKAYKVRSVAVAVQYEVPLKVAPSMGDAHKLFLLHVSKLIQQDQRKQADALLVNSNEFLLSVLESAQLYVPKMIALSLFEANARFAADVVSSKKWAAASPELKASLRIGPSVQQIIETSAKAEFLAAVSIVRQSASVGPAYTFDDAGGNATIEKFLLRPQETINWLAQIYSEITDPRCDVDDLSKCSAIYKSEIDAPNVVQMLSNPVGRKIVRILVPKTFFARDSIQGKVDAVNAIAAGL